MKSKRFRTLKASVREFAQADCFNLSASLSYYTVFSLAPMLIVIIAVASWFIGKEAVTGALFGQIQDMIGPQAAEAVQSMMAHAYHPKASIFASIAGTLTLLFASTGVFAQLQNSLNKIWGVKAKPGQKRQWLRTIQKRFLSFGMVLSIVFLLMVSLASSALIAAFWGRIENSLPDYSAVLLKLLELSVTVLSTSVVFAVMFKFLPDIRISWREVWKGGILTALLFEIGKNIIGLYLGRSNIASAYGGAGAIVIIMLWVNYSALIFFFGAAFTKANALLHGNTVKPKDFAVLRDEDFPVREAA